MRIIHALYSDTSQSSFMQPEGQLLAICLIQVERGHFVTRQGVLRDFCDGEAYQQHPLFTLHFDALQVLFYYDEVEVCNPLGSKKKKHKMGNNYSSEILIVLPKWTGFIAHCTVNPSFNNAINYYSTLLPQILPTITFFKVN